MKSYSCQICGRELTDNESIAAGVGPGCAAKRGTFYTTCGTSETEISSLEAAGPDAARWIRNFRTEMRAGNVRWAKKCLESARHRAQPVAPVTPVATPVVIASEPPQPVIVVRPSDRGFRVHPPYCHPQFVAVFKRTISGRWYPELAEWFIPAVCLEWAKELLEDWFSMPVYVETAQ